MQQIKSSNPFIHYSFLLVTLLVFYLALATTTAMAGPINLREKRNGMASFYKPSGQTSACGQVITANDVAVSVSSDILPSADPNKYCGKKMVIENASGSNNTIVATVSDNCEDCGSPDDIVVTPAAFQQLGGKPEDGRIPVAWHFAD